MATMREAPHCPDCGSPITAEEAWSEELCPHCLLRLALEESSGEEDGRVQSILNLDDGTRTRLPEVHHQDRTGGHIDPTVAAVVRDQARLAKSGTRIERFRFSLRGRYGGRSW